MFLTCFCGQGASGLREFGEELRSVVKSIIPQNAPLHIVLDGLSEDREEEAPQGNVHPFRIGPAQLEVSGFPSCPKVLI